MKSSGFGACHLCKRLRDVQLCQMCDHWFCGDCKTRRFNNLWNRGVEAVKQVVGGKKPGCCGLLPEVLPLVISAVRGEREAR